MTLNEPLIRDVPAQRIVGKKGTGPYGETISRLMPALCDQIFSEENQKNGLKVTGPFMTLYHDCEYREKDATMECVAPITGRIILSDPAMEVRTLPGGKVLSLIHKGSYNTLHEAWSRIGAYAEEREFVPNGPHREVYLNDPNVVPEEELLTELQIPVDTAGRKHFPGSRQRKYHFFPVSFSSHLDGPTGFSLFREFVHIIISGESSFMPAVTL